MAGPSSIEWTDCTWNPVRGCSRLSEGCRRCYAEGVAARFSGPGRPYEGLAQFVTRSDGSREARWTGKLTWDHDLTAPLKWRKPRRIFVNSMSDLFHEAVPDEAIDRVFAVMALAPRHTFQILTKRPERMRAYMAERSVDFSTTLAAAWRAIDAPPALERQSLLRVWPQGGACLGRDLLWPLPNVWLGVSAEDQAAADARIPDLLATPAAVRFVSAEPLLGALRLDEVDDGLSDGTRLTINALTGEISDGHQVVTGVFGQPDPRLDWVIVGGESGPRPMHPDWARALRDQCAAAGTAFFFKQWGEWLPGQNDYPPQSYNVGHRVAHWQDGGWGPRKVSRGLLSKNYVMWDSTGTLHSGTARLDGGFFEVAAWAQRVGKARAGRLLDGREHNDMPGAAR